jgi:NADH dehydrogenase
MRRQLATGAAIAGGAVFIRWALAMTSPGRDAKVPHARQSEQAYRAAEHRVLILGAGFGGLSTALELDRQLRRAGRKDVSTLVIDRDNSQVFTPLLWLVANGRANPSNVVVPVRALQWGRSFHLLQAQVERVDLERREVVTTAGARPFDTLVIALGSITAIPNLPGLAEHARVFRTATDALELRNHLIDAIETAHRTDDPDERRAWLTFVIGGGGDTGIELAATVHEYLQYGLFAEYPWLEDDTPRVIVVGRAERLVPLSSEKTSAEVRRILEREGIEVLTGVAITGATADTVRTSQGDIRTHTFFWAAGIAAPAVVRGIPVPHARNGAILVDERLRVRDHEHIYVVGDAAWATDAANPNGVPPTAQAAEHEGAYVAGAIAAQLAGETPPPFEFKPRGHLALLGRGTGVAQIGKYNITGFLAWFLWHGYYLTHIGTVRNRTRMIADLVLSALTGRETGQLRIDPLESPGAD